MGCTNRHARTDRNAQDTHHERPNVCRNRKVAAPALTALLPKVPATIALPQSLISTRITDFTRIPEHNIDNPTNQPQCLRDRDIRARSHRKTRKCALKFEHTTRSTRPALPKCTISWT